MQLTIARFEKRHPGWHAWRGPNRARKYYARRVDPLTSPPAVVWGRDLADLSGKVILWEQERSRR